MSGTAAAATRRVTLIERLGAERAALTTRITERIAAEIEEYGSRDEPAFRADLHAHVDANFGALLASLRSGEPPRREDLAFVREVVTRRASQGVSLDDVLHAFRLGHRVLWEEILAMAGESADGRGAAVDLAGPSMEYIDTVSNHVAEAFLERHGRLAARGDRIARDLLEDLLAGRPPSGRTAQLAQEIRLTPGSDLLVAVAGHDAELLAPLARRVRDAWPPPYLPLAVVRHDELVVTGRVEPRQTGAACLAFEAVLVATGAELRGGVGAPCSGTAEIPRAYAEARAALQTVGGGGVAALPTVSPLEYLVSAADETARRLVPAAVRALDDRLVQTVEVYAGCDLNARRTAAVLGLHPNTVHHRLRKLGELTGRDLRRFEPVQELLVELRILGRPRARG